jgi:hypothetical protein
LRRPKWLIIAKNEYLLKTSGFRRYRKVFPFLALAAVMLYVLFVAPAMFSLASDYTRTFLLSDAALAFMQVMLFVIFVSILTIPIMQTLQDTNITPLETVLSAPVEPKDVLLGKYLGSLPLYAIVVSIIAGTFLALFIPFGMTMDQVLLAVLVFILIIMSALWIGVLIAAILKAWLGRSVRGREAGQALAMLISLPLVAVMYSAMNGDMLDALQGRGSPLSGSFLLLPSSWGADVIIRFLHHPGDVGFDLASTVLGIFGLTAFLIGSIFVGVKLSGRAYDLEPVSFSTAKAKPEGGFYRYVRLLSAKGSFATVVVTVMKDYGRRLENISRVIYILGLVSMMELFMLSSLPQGDYVSIALLTITWMMAFLCVFVVGEVTARGKDNLFIYRKAPRGESRLIRARIMQGCIVVQPVAAISALIVLVPSSVPWMDTILLTLAVVAIATAYVIMSIGLFLLSPSFSERPMEAIWNAISVLAISFFLYVICIVAFGEPWGLLALLLLSSGIGSILLMAGSRKIKSIE